MEYPNDNIENIFKRFRGLFFMPIKWPYIFILILILISLCYLFYPKIENFFIFFPQTSFDFQPQDMGLAYRDVYLNTSDGQKLHGWFFPKKRQDPVILFCHGNAGNISHRLDNVQRLLKMDLQVLIFDYRGYGKSSGRPSEKGLYRDGLAAYAYLVENENIPPEQIILFGRSLGAAVVMEIACRKPARSIIIESAFTSVKDMAKNITLFRVLAWAIPAHYNNLGKISGIRTPLLIIHGDQDEMVPFNMGQRLFETAQGPKYFLRLSGAGHNDTYEVGGEDYFRGFKTFVKEGRI
jgi:fermentation-respiration switch protein FrsA (DUF1100 family)